MKTIEQKAIAYDEALEIAKKNYDVAQDLCSCSQIGVECFKNTLTNIFPELKESDDERIRKALINILNEIVIDTNYKELDIDYSIRDMIAWIEKQGEQKSINYNEELKKCRENPLYFINKYVKLENRHSTWSKDDERIRKALIDYFDDAYKSDENPLHGIRTYEAIDWLERQGECTWKLTE